MFRRRAPRNDEPSPGAGGEPVSFLHEGTVVRGAVEASGRLRVHGTILGDVRVAGVLEIASGGLVEGATVEADEVRVLGTVRAAITASGKVEIWKGGIVEGDVTTTALDIEEGATFVGRSEMRPRAPALSAPAEGGAGDAHAAADGALQGGGRGVPTVEDAVHGRAGG